MILINKGESNTVVLTLKEKTTLSPVYYLFEFINDLTHVSYFFIPTDISEFPDRYNKFLITEGSEGDIELGLSGYYKYVIREQASSSNIDPDESGEIVETGKVKVIGDAVTNTTYDEQVKTNIVYGG
jgi:hypothetical protein